MADTIKEAAANEGHNVSHDKDHEETAGPNVEQTEQPGGAGNIPGDVRDQIIATVYGQCMGDAIGLLSEFYDKEEAVELFGKIKELEYETKNIANDMHRMRWETGDWTDDSDQMLLIMQSLLDNAGEIDPKDYGVKLHNWMKNGFKELGDRGGLGIGRTTNCILRHPDFLSDPHKVAEEVWNNSQRKIAPNGGVMRTSILGIHDWWDTDSVEKNAVAICKVTHRDPRCLASVVAVCVAISLMLQKKHFNGKHYDIKSIKTEAQQLAAAYLREDEFPQYIEELNKHMNVNRLRDLKLDEPGCIGYTFKCMGAGFWALKKDNFREALQRIVLEGGDSDTNGAVVGALLACKLRHTDKLPQSWTKFKHKEWLDQKIASYLDLLGRRFAKKKTS